MSRLVLAHAVLVGILALAVVSGALPMKAAPTVSREEVPLAPHPLVSGVTFVAAGGFVGGTDLTSVDATVAGVAGDTLFAFGAEGFAVGTPAFNDSRSLTWTTNLSTTIGGFGFVFAVANETTTGADTVTFADSGSGSLTLGVWDVGGSGGRFSHFGNGSSGSGTAVADSVFVGNASGLVGFFNVALRATGGCSNAADPGLTYAVGGNSISHTDGSCGLWAAPPNGTGFLPVDGGVNSSTTLAGIAFSIDPASSPPGLTGAIASFGPSPCEVGSCRVLFNGTAAGGTPPYSFDWAWGDGSSDTVDSGNSSGSDATAHTFATSGVFPVVLNVTDNASGSSLAFANVTVVPAALPTATTNLTSPCVVADANSTCLVTFTTNLSFGLARYDVEFLLLNDTGAVVDSSFGNASSTAAFNATFPENLTVGTYNAWLNVTDGSGHSFSAHEVFVVELPGSGGGLVSTGTFDLILFGSVAGVLAIACVGMAAGSRRRRRRVR